jgi:hypothetical protein
VAKSVSGIHPNPGRRGFAIVPRPHDTAIVQMGDEMGTYRLILWRINQLLSWPAINELDPDTVAERSLHDAAHALGDWEAKELAVLGTMPEGMQEAVRALIHQNLNRTQRMEVQFVWLRGAAWKLTVSEDSPAGGDGYPGAITVLLESPHPDDLLAAK